jgi:hypothetical protein
MVRDKDRSLRSDISIHKRFKGHTRPCWNCGADVQFLPTELAPRGAWVDAGTQDHHRCPHELSAEQLNHMKSI